MPGRLAWLPLPLFALALVGLWAADLRTPYESASLLLAFNLVFSVLVCLFIAFLVGRTFLARSAPGLLLLGCGVLIWGAAGFVAVAAGLVAEGGRFDINLLITIHNSCVWLSGLCHLAGVLLALRWRQPLRPAALWLVAGYTLALGAVALVTVAALAGWTPTFFVQGRGGTVLRDVVLVSALAMFACTAVLLQSPSRRPLSPFSYWYSLALGLIAVGLFGIAIESVHGSILSWAGRAPQFLSGVYMLISAVASARESHVWRIPLEAALQRERDLNAAILSTVGALVTVLDLDGRVVRFNRACEQLTGYRFEEVQGRPFWDFLILPEERAGVQRTFAALRAGEFPNEHENHWVARDGGRRLVHWSNTVLTDSSGAAEYVIGTGIDITERQQAEVALRQASERLRMAQHAAGAGMWDWDIATGHLEWSPELFALFGLDPAKAAASFATWEAVLHPEDREGARARIDDALREHAPLVSEYRVVLPDGTIRWVNALGQGTYDELDRPVRMAGICIDITARKQAEEQVQVTLESVGDGFFSCDGEWRFVYVNARAEGILGINRAEVLGRSHWEVFPLTLGTLLEEEYRRAAAGEVRDFENHYAPWDRWFHNTCYPREGGGVSVYFREITARKRAEEERERLHTEVERQARLLDTIVTATDSRLAYLGRDLRYIRVNAAYAANARMAPEEFVGRHRLEVFPNAPEVAAMYQRVLDSGEPESIAEYTGVPKYRPEVGPRTVRIDAAPVKNERGEVEGLVTSMVDITVQVWQRQQLLEAERARAQLAETLGREIAHRTKNNLAIVAGLLQLQLDREDASATHADLIRDAVTRIMSFAALHEQMYQRHSDTVELLDALRRIAEVDRQALSAGEVTISVQGESADYPSSVATNLCVVANELVTNAIKHGTTQGGARQVELRLSRDRGRLVLSVWNSHNPVAAGFDVGRQGRTGLGLVRSIVEDQYGGSFTLVPDRGGTLANVALDDEQLLKR